MKEGQIGQVVGDLAKVRPEQRHVSRILRHLSI
jgi:hypothetical protein